MEVFPLPGTVCSTCGEPLNANGSCLVCLLRGGMEETADDEETSVVAEAGYGDFEVARREDGSLWELGRGAMGVTYRAVDRVLHRAVALKVIQLGSPAGNHEHRKSEALRERFLREARAAAALRHTNVAGIYQFGASDQADRCFYAMELVEGETLELRVRRDGPLDVLAALEVGRQVCAALVAAAARGLIHRDLKPGNLMLASSTGGAPAEMEVKVIDFGLAKAAAAAIGEADLTHGGFVGTPAFASPEQFARQPVDARSDLYSLGITLWYALTGRTPFTGRTLEELRDDPARSKLPVEQLTARGVPACVVALLRRVLAADPAGRPASAKELLDALDACRQRLTRANAPTIPRLLLAAVIAVVLTLAAAGGVWWWTHPPAAASRPAPPVPGKSIAILPFDNFSEDKDSAFFADGVQDEVLTDLAKIADLKVISRSSVTQYKDAKQRNVRDIGKTLDVAYVVEGSVRRAGNKVRVTAQLIDAHTDAHRWAEQYDGDLSDIFAIQSQMARQIADALHTQLSPAEKAVIAERPTDDLEAYRLYTLATDIFIYDDTQNASKSLTHKIELLEEAIQRDPRFALAYCTLAKAQGEYAGMGGGEVQLGLARKSAEMALQLRPDLGESHRAMAICYENEGDLDRARAEIMVALRTLPNDAEALKIAGMIDEPQNRWDDALAKLKKAFELDPKNEEVSYRLGGVYHETRRYREWEQLLRKRVPRNESEHYWIQLGLAEVKLDTGDAAAAKALLDGVPLDFNPTGEFCFVRYRTALFLRDYKAAAQVMASVPAEFAEEMCGGTPPDSELDGRLAHLRGDEPRAQAIFAALRQKLDANLVKGKKDEGYFDNAAGFDAWLGRKELAIRESQQAVALMPITKDATAYPGYVAGLAWTYMMAGKKDLAIEQLKLAASLPAGPSYGDLRLNPGWDPLRGDPRFEAIVASLVPK